MTLGLLACAGFQSAFAQTALPDLNPQSIPGVIQQSGFEDQKRQQQNEALLENGRKNDPVVETEPPEPGLEDADAESPRFVLHELLLSGVTVMEPERLQKEFSPWIDREVSYGDLLQIASAITELYKNEGYITTRAILPPQEVENGSVRIHVLEGRVGDIKISGNEYVRDKYIRARVSQKQDDVFRLKTLQKDMLDLSRNGLFDNVHATLKSGHKAGASDIVLEIEDHRPYHLSLSFDNQGRPGIGIYRTGVTMSHENLLGYGDSAVANVSLTSNIVSAFGQYQFPLGTDGWSVGANYGYTAVDAGKSDGPVWVGNTQKVRSIEGRSHRLSSFVNVPVYHTPLTREWDISGQLSLNVIESMTYLDGHSLRDVNYGLALRVPGFNPDPVPSVRTVKTELQAAKQGKQGRWLMSASMTNGLGTLGGNQQFVKFNANMTRIQALPWGLVGILRTESQFTPGHLPFVEKIQAGGINTVRGYSEGWLIADKGFVASGELRAPLKFLPEKYEKDWQGVAFVDYAALFATKNSPDGLYGNPGYLLGYGIGLRGRLSRHVNARVDLGVSGIQSGSQPDVWAHFTLQSQLF